MLFANDISSHLIIPLQVRKLRFRGSQLVSGGTKIWTQVWLQSGCSWPLYLCLSKVKWMALGLNMQPPANSISSSSNATGIWVCHLWVVGSSRLSTGSAGCPSPGQILHTHHPSQTPSNHGDDYPHCMDEKTEAMSMDHLFSSDPVLGGIPEPNSPGQRAHSTA